MSGYFRRLLTQSAITTTQFRPVRVHPYAAGVDRFAELHLGSAAGGDLDAGSEGDAAGVQSPGAAVARSGGEEGRAIGDAVRAPERGVRRSGRRGTPGDAERAVAGSVASTTPPGAERRPDGTAIPASASDSSPAADIPARTRAVRGDAGSAPGTPALAPVLAASSSEASDRRRGDSNFRLLPDAAVDGRQPGGALGPVSRRDLGVERSAARGIGSPQAGDERPDVHVTIGRIEVTAQHLPAPAKKRREQPAAMSLDEYLSRRRQGGA